MTRPFSYSPVSPSSWVETAPAGWKVAPLGTHFAERKETVSDTEFQPLSVTKGGVVPQLDTAAKTDNNDNRKLVRAGDFVINSRSDRKGSAGLSELDGSVSVIYTVLTPRSTIDGRFAHHLLRSQAFQEEFYRWGTGIVADLWSTRYSTMKRIPLALPQPDEQRAIADYLDHETSQLDMLIEEQQRLTLLLRERRSAVAEDAVVGGVANDAALTSSNIPWLRGARTPSHWVVSRLKYIAVDLRAGESITADSIESEGPYPVYGGNGLRGYTDSKTHEGTFVLIGRQGALCGNVHLVSGSFWASEHAIVVTPTEDIDSRWLAHLLRTMNLGQYSMTSAQPGIGVGQLEPLEVPLPPRKEQCAIAERIDDQVAKIDELIAETERFIELARERRSALITAAVTGQIDVRGEVA